MEACCCDLQVDVNGEETFIVNKKLLSSYSGRLSTLFRYSKGTTNFKVVFHEFPGGSEGFELMTRFCYNNGTIEINPSNIALLYCVAHFMEMKNSVSIASNLLEQTEKSLAEISDWTWSELLVALRQCQHLQPHVNHSGILQICFDSLVGKLASSESSTSVSSSSPDSSRVRYSFDSRSTESLRSSSSGVSSWFDEFVVLNPYLVQLLVKTMVSWQFDHVMIGSFLVHYQKIRFQTASLNEKRAVTETVIDALYTLSGCSVPCKCLFGILQGAWNLNIEKACRSKLEKMIGLQMNQATLDNLLLPSPRGRKYIYDVNLVQRCLKAFLSQDTCQLYPLDLRKVSSLIDSYLTEVAPDPHLKPSKFLVLATALPDSARESCDGLYRAVDMYLEVHTGLREDESAKIWCALNYEKLSYDASVHLSRNTKFPSTCAFQALRSQQTKTRSLAQDANQNRPSKRLPPLPHRPIQTSSEGKRDQGHELNGFFSRKFDSNHSLKTHLHGMQSRVVELESACKQMHTQMRRIMKSRSTHSSMAPRSLYKFF